MMLAVTQPSSSGVMRNASLCGARSQHRLHEQRDEGDTAKQSPACQDAVRRGCGKQAVTEKRKRQDRVGGAALHPQQQDEKHDGARDQDPAGCAGTHQTEQEHDHADRQQSRAGVIHCGSFVTVRA